MRGPNIQPIHVKGDKEYRHPEQRCGVPILPWPVGSAKANRFFNERAHRRNQRRSYGTRGP